MALGKDRREMNVRLRLLLVLLWLLFQQSATGQAAEQSPLKVLFIGNSYTSVNDLPGLIVGLAQAAGGRKIEADRHLVGGCTLERHVKDVKAVEKIREKKWDAVVLQEQSLRPVIERDLMLQYSRILHSEIQKQGSRMIFYLTWARQDIPQMQEGAEPTSSSRYARTMYGLSGVKNVDFRAWCNEQRKGLAGGLNGAYFGIAQELNAEVAPVGVAWKAALEADPNRVLHRPDKSHPTPLGSYLAACVFYGTLVDRSPVGLPGEIKVEGRVLVQVAAAEARLLQEIAWRVVEEAKQHYSGEAPSGGIRKSG